MQRCRRIYKYILFEPHGIHSTCYFVGTAKIVGRVHMAQMKLGQSFFPISLTVLENDDVDFLFGLDMLKRHRCAIDLRDNVLRVEGSRGIEEAPFLSEGMNFFKHKCLHTYYTLLHFPLPYYAVVFS